MPVWEEGLTSMWGGMEAGPEMIYSSQSVDGRLHLEGGIEMKVMLRSLYPGGCKVGEAVTTPAPEQLLSKYGFKYIIHAVPPLRCSWSDCSTLPGELVACYKSALNIFMASEDMRCAVMPLIGSGAAGFSTHEAACCLSTALTPSSNIKAPRKTVRITLLDYSSVDIIWDILMAGADISTRKA